MTERRTNRDKLADKWRRSIWGKEAVATISNENVRAAIIVLQARKVRLS